MSTAQLCIGGVLDVHHPASYKYGQPGKEKVLHVQVGEPSLGTRQKEQRILWDGHTELQFSVMALKRKKKSTLNEFYYHVIFDSTRYLFRNSMCELTFVVQITFIDLLAYFHFG